MKVGDIIKHTHYGKGIILEENNTLYDGEEGFFSPISHDAPHYCVYFFNRPYDLYRHRNLHKSTKSSQKSFIFENTNTIEVPQNSIILYNGKS
tara:strand:+ start:262 stop:540 length:279 start_codon:yes stop_codon:yes gene_type:complete